MSNDAAASRMRMNLIRDYGIKTFNIGRNILSIRIPHRDLSAFGKNDTERIQQKINENLSQLRPTEVQEVFIIADRDYVVLDPGELFGPMDLMEIEIPSYEKDISGLVYKNSEDGQSRPALTGEESLANMPVEESSKTGQDFPELPAEDMIIRVERKKPVRIQKVNDQKKPRVISTKTEKESHETLSNAETENIPENNAAEATVIKDAENIKKTRTITSEEEIPGQSEPVHSNRTQPVKIQAPEDPEDKDAVISKILTDFTKTNQKKKIVTGRLKSGRRAEVLTRSKRGRYVRSRLPEGDEITDIAIGPTVRAAARHAKDGKVVINKGDLREKIRRRRVSTLINIVFDTSGSMDEQEKINTTTDVVIALLKDAYQRRDRISLVTYSGRSGQLILPFTSSVEAAKRYLEKVPFGGTTPMASGMLTGLETILYELKREPSAIPIMILVTDGTANVSLEVGGNIRRELLRTARQIAHYKVNLLVVDISKEGSEVALNIAAECRGKYYHPVLLSKESLYSAITEERDDVASLLN